jgi:hypothetical protein
MYYQSNNLTTRAISLCPSFLFLYSGLFDWLPLMVFHCCILLYCYNFCFININISTHSHTVVNLLWNDLCLEWNTQSELKVLTFGEIMYYQSNNLTTRAIGLCPSFLFLYSGLFDWLHLTCKNFFLFFFIVENFIAK